MVFHSLKTSKTHLMGRPHSFLDNERPSLAIYIGIRRIGCRIFTIYYLIFIILFAMNQNFQDLFFSCMKGPKKLDLEPNCYTTEPRTDKQHRGSRLSRIFSRKQILFACLLIRQVPFTLYISTERRMACRLGHSLSLLRRGTP